MRRTDEEINEKLEYFRLRAQSYRTDIRKKNQLKIALLEWVLGEERNIW